MCHKSYSELTFEPKTLVANKGRVPSGCQAPFPPLRLLTTGGACPERRVLCELGRGQRELGASSVLTAGCCDRARGRGGRGPGMILVRSGPLPGQERGDCWPKGSQGLLTPLPAPRPAPQIMLLETARRYNHETECITFLKDFTYSKDDFHRAGTLSAAGDGAGCGDLPGRPRLPRPCLRLRFSISKVG